MRIRIDEAGDFSYRNATRFSVSVVAGIVIPDRRRAAVECFVHERQTMWDMAELKAADLDDAQLMDVSQFVIAENLTVAAITTDSRIFTGAMHWLQTDPDDKPAADPYEFAADDPVNFTDPQGEISLATACVVLRLALAAICSGNAPIGSLESAPVQEIQHSLSLLSDAFTDVADNSTRRGHL